MTEITAPLSPGITQAIANAAQAANLSLPQRMIQHRKNLRAIAFHQGIDGTAEYKKENPEAASIRIDLTAFAYSPKPKGYDTYLASLAERWFVSEGSVDASNSADVEKLNVRFGTTFPPGKHFSETLPTRRLEKIRTVFSRYGVPLNIKQANTMSKVRAVAKAGMVRINPVRRIGSLGVISGNTLVVGNQPFPIERNGQRDCIRVTIEGKRRRLYLAEMEWLAELLVGGGVDPLSTTTVRSMGEMAYAVPEPDLSLSTTCEIQEPACNGNTEATDIPSPYVDPLELDPLELEDMLRVCSLD